MLPGIARLAPARYQGGMTEFPARAPSPASSEPADGAPADRARRLLVIHNPVAGWRRLGRFRRTVEQLEQRGCTITERATTGPGDAESIARDAGDVDVVVVAGGDGTVNEALNGLMQRPGGPLPLAVIPLGTANVLAGELGLPIDPEGAARAIAHGRIVTAHLGQARFDGRTRRFALMAGAGFDAQAVARVRTRVKRKLGKGAYVLAGLEAAASYRYPNLTVHVDGQTHACAQVVVCKGHFYAGRYVLAPEVRPWLPELHVVLFERPGTLNAARYALGMQLDRLQGLPDVRVLPGARAVRIEGPAGDPVQGDGDLVGTLPVEIELLEDAARFVVGDPP
jgi:YegS/Rv2252/BmrU family lipid kinase